MSNESKEVNISIYYMWEWWEKYFHKDYPRPQVSSDDAIDDMYLKRKRYLFEQFAEFGMGEETPVMDGKFVNMVMKYGMDLIPYLLGAPIYCQEVGGWMSKPFSKQELMNMKPVNIADHPFAEWAVKQRDKNIKRYGSASDFFDYQGPANIAVRLRGEEFYIDLLDDEEFAKNTLGLVNEIIFDIFRFTVKEFEGAHAFGLANCNVTMISPELYEEVIKPFDISFFKKSAEITGSKNDLLLHHCDVKVDRFIDAYKGLPHMGLLQASHDSDIERIKKELNVKYCAMFNPMDLINHDTEQLEKDVERAVQLGSAEIDLWNISPECSPEKLRGIFSSITNIGKRNNIKINFDTIPFCWDELEWAFPKYQIG